jgi:tetratricopeptide (TPR) repeat protein
MAEEQPVRTGSVAKLAEAMFRAFPAQAEKEGKLGRCVFFIGAGCSITAGVPGAAQIAQDCIRQLAIDYRVGDLAEPLAALKELVRLRHFKLPGLIELPPARLKELPSEKIDWWNVYDHVFTTHYSSADQTRAIFANIVQQAGRGINWAHLCLGDLVSRGFVSTVITTNFDQLVLDGMVRADVIPAVCDGIESLNRVAGHPGHPQLVEIHGSRHTYHLRNSTTDVAALQKDPVTRGAVARILQEARVFAVVGYGGRETGIMDALVEAALEFPDKEVVWVAHGEIEGLSEKARRFLSSSRASFAIPGQDADTFFMELSRILGTGVPRSIRDPIDHAQQLAGRVAEINDRDIRKVINRHRGELLQLGAALQNSRSKRSELDKTLDEARELRLEGNRRAELARLERYVSRHGRKDPELLETLADAALSVGRRDSQKKYLDRAADSYTRLLAKLQRNPGNSGDRARVNGHLANALRSLGERAEGKKAIDYLKRAVAACEAASSVYTRARTPAQWAMTQNSLANALSSLGEVTKGKVAIGHLQRAVKVHKAALTVYTGSAMRSQWAMTQNNLATVFMALGERIEPRAAALDHFNRALDALDAALTVHTRIAMQYRHAQSKENLGTALAARGKLTRSRVDVEAAIERFNEALEIYTSDNAGYDIDTCKAARADAEKLLREIKAELA